MKYKIKRPQSESSSVQKMTATQYAEKQILIHGKLMGVAAFINDMNNLKIEPSFDIVKREMIAIYQEHLKLKEEYDASLDLR